MLDFDKHKAQKLEAYGRWDKIGLLKGIKDDFHKTVIAMILDNQRLYNEKFPLAENDESDKAFNALFKRLSIPLARRVFSPGQFIAYKLASVQTLVSPTDEFYHPNKYGLIVPHPVKARARLLTTGFPLVEIENLEETETTLRQWFGRFYFNEEASQYATSPNGIDNEAEITSRMANDLVRELNKEVISDLSSTAAFQAEHVWLNPAKLADAVLAVSNAIGGRIGSSANWIVTSDELATHLARHFDLKEFTGVNFQANKIGYVGHVANKWHLYAINEDYFPVTQLVMGYNRPTLESGYYYCPYIAFSPTAKPRTNMLARYAKHLVSGDYYGVIQVENYSITKGIEHESEPEPVSGAEPYTAQQLLAGVGEEEGSGS